MRVYLILFFLVYGCNKDIQNEVEFTPTVMAKKLPALGGSESSIYVTSSKEINLGLEVISGDFVSTMINLSESEKKKIEPTHQYLKWKILNWFLRKLQGPASNNNIHFSMGDERFVKVSSWKDQNYFPVEKILKQSFDGDDLVGNFSYKIGIDPLVSPGAESISDIVVGTYLLNKKNNTMDRIGTQQLTKFEGQDEILILDNEYLKLSYEISGEEIHGGYLLDLMRQRADMYVRIDDYTVNYNNGTSRRFSDIEQEYKNEFSQVIISYKDKVMIFYTSPGKKLEDMLREHNLIFHSDSNGQLVALAGIQSNLKLPLDWNALSYNDLDRGAWRLYGIDKIDQRLEGGKVYVIAHDIVRNVAPKKVTTRDLSYSGDQYFEILDVAGGDIIQFELSGKSFFPIFKNVVKDIDYRYDHNFKRIVEISPGVLKEVYIGGPEISSMMEKCSVWHRQRYGEFSRDIFFTEKSLSERLKVVSDGIEHRLDQLLFVGNDIALIEGGRVAKWRIKVPVDARKMSISFKDPLKTFVGSTGFVGWHDCSVRDNKGFEIKGYSLEQKKHEYKIRNKYDGKLLIRKVL